MHSSTWYYVDEIIKQYAWLPTLAPVSLVLNALKQGAATCWTTV